MTFWSNVLIPVTSMMITVFATLYTVSQRVKNENREKHKPYLTLNNIEQQEKLDEYQPLASHKTHGIPFPSFR